MRKPKPLEDKPSPYPWEQQNDEGAKAWAAFQLYRDGGPGRSLRETARNTNKHLTQIAGWSKRHRWVERCAEWDGYTDRVRREANLKAMEEMTKRHARTAQVGISVVNQLLATFLQRVKFQQDHPVIDANGNPQPLFFGVADRELILAVIQAGRGLDSLTKVERIARGLPETWIAINQMSDEQLQAYVVTLLSEREAAGAGLGALGDEAAGNGPTDQSTGDE